MKHTKGKRNRVRSHHALKGRAFTVCSNCKAEIIPHVVCKNCGHYNGRKVVDVLKKANKKEAKKTKKQAKAHEGHEGHDHE